MNLDARALDSAATVGEKKEAWAKATRVSGVAALVVVVLYATGTGWGRGSAYQSLVTGHREPVITWWPLWTILQLVLVKVASHLASHSRPSDRRAVLSRSGKI
jgi:fatty acid desaturase